jgi:hypothetical protein
MTGVLWLGMFGPFDLDRYERGIVFDNEIDFSPLPGALIMEFASPEVLEPFPEFNSYPLLQKRARIDLHGLKGRNQSGGCMPHP